MSDSRNNRGEQTVSPKEAPVRRTRFSLILLIPVVAILIAGWLAWEHFATRGPVITITFETADGLTPGQTQVKNKAVTLGTVQDITLSDDMKHVDVTVQMNANSAHILTDHTRFWVVRPRINGASITGLDTLFSGAYIALDPGTDDGHYQKFFKGLESPPGVRSDQPGETFWLVSPSLGSLGPGSPVFFRDLQVGEVLGYTMPPGGTGPIVIQAFVKDPYDHYLRTDSRFWNVSGVQVGLGAGGLKVQLKSLQALFSGGIAFGLPERRRNIDLPDAPANSVFKLYASEADADNARYHKRLRVVTYINSSVKGLTTGSQVTMFGLQIGSVTDVHLLFDGPAKLPRVRVDMELEPERVLSNWDDRIENAKEGSVEKYLQAFVADGMRASVQSASFLTGESMIALQFVKNAPVTPLTYEGDVAVLPSQAGGMDGIMESVSTITDKIAAMPLTEIGGHVNDLLAHADGRLNSPEVTQSLAALRDSLQNLNRLTKTANQNLPALMKELQGTLSNAQAVLGAYGGDTDFHRSLQGMITQLTQMSRSLRFLTDYLDHHPSALITGRRN
ncbi:PqiB family protein [Gluconobacter kanchanaburiensis]|uniref:Paraquat-inducible protein B n=1 Tax=Gluconobacter kanchanaburiensis NBRC 103587 TaxID=1307948 RepID=A0A511B7C9_9PROT|nr:MlaD family protein [Gluconobacter kanchanaburiensis]MBF0862376.1 MCE family protein [Gluconobacter kanchanaburiensis]GBR68769.1 paraquat-inducible protein B [Gluconobacter kanchanaburiensis NBRC 103587]GEK96365.1 paraquat-inducible protein B [Gluconobacter kanchanaburiensis NBRC 103587]